MKDITKKSAALAAEKLRRVIREAYEVGRLKGELEYREQQLEALRKTIEPEIGRELEFIRKDMSLKTAIAIILGDIENNHTDRQKVWLSAGEIRKELHVRYNLKYGPTATRNCLVIGERSESKLFERKGKGKGTKWRYIGEVSPLELFQKDLGATDKEMKERY